MMFLQIPMMLATAEFMAAWSSRHGQAGMKRRPNVPRDTKRLQGHRTPTPGSGDPRRDPFWRAAHDERIRRHAARVAQDEGPAPPPAQDASGQLLLFSSG